ncbi:MAG: glycosyltransferase [Kiritimatiellae bacterium]|nr:glycosyltransferase [Kiritimatiellia bacterium]
MKISVITPSFNQGTFIERTITSVLAQQGDFELEYIVVDGLSTDDSVQIIRKHESHLTWLSEKDDGQSDAINKGFRIATGDVLGWLNSDDTYVPGALDTVAAEYGRAPFKWCFGNCHIIDEHDREIRACITRYKVAQSRKYSFARLLRRDFVPQPATFFSRAAYAETGGLDTNLYYSMDYDYWLRLGRRYPPVYIPRFLANFRWHSSSKNASLYRGAAWETYLTARRHAQGRERLDVFMHYWHYRALCLLYRFL